MKFSQSKFAKHGSLRAWLIITCGALFYCYQFIIRVSPNIIHDDLVANFKIDEAMFGFMIGLYYWGYSSMQLPLGIAMDRLGPRRVITSAILICALACLIFSLTQNIIIASTARVMMGVGAASGLMGSLKLGSLWLPPRRMGLVTAITMAFGTLGASIGGTPLRLLTLEIGWENTYKLFALVGLLLAVLVYIIVRDKPKGSKYDEKKIKKINPSNIFEGLKQVIKTPQAWLIALFGALMYMPITVLGIAWGIPLLKSIYSISDLKAAPIAAAMFIGAALGSPIFALLSDYHKSRKFPMYFGGICCLVIWIVIIRVPNIPIYFMYSLFFAGGFFYTAKILTFAANCEIQASCNSAVTVGFTNMIVMLTGAISHPVVGSLLEYKSNNNITSVDDYRFALSIVPICLFIGIIILFFIKETYPKTTGN
ncbi:MAG: MFS transporter [Bacteroidetes bacterium]|nr:MFS transporter [Bacteroidota bacterium]